MAAKRASSDQASTLTVLMTGGGSGGHVTPALAVAHQLKQIEPHVWIVYVGQTGDSLQDIPTANPDIDEVHNIRAGKFRRYHGEGWRQVFDLPTVAKNVRDACFVLIGIFQSFWLLRRIRPQVIFTRGSFVSVPIAIAAAWLKIPYVTHDSDALPGLANRLIARRAALHAVALPKEIYPYPAAKTITVGIPIAHHFERVDEAGRRAARQRLHLAPDRKVILVVGGGLGAQRLNEAVLAITPTILDQHSDLTLILQAGRSNQAGVVARFDAEVPSNSRGRVQVLGFVTNMYDYSAAADLVVTRAGGTNIAEFAAQAKACIVVPNPELTGGHQTKNAQVLVDRKAVLVVSEERIRIEGPQVLQKAIEGLLQSPEQLRQLGNNLHQLAQPDAARRLGMVLLDMGRTHSAGSAYDTAQNAAK